jgi:hypothetical protein
MLSAAIWRTRASSPVAPGVGYYVSQSSAELGWFAPDVCDFHAIIP